MAAALANPEPEAPRRLVDAGLAAALEPFDDPRLLAEGRVTLVSVEAVQRRFGKRWPLRQEQVHDFAQRVLQRGIGREGFFQRVSETDYLIVHAELSRNAGHAACLGYLSEVLQHFLGDSLAAGAGVLVVRRIGDGELHADHIDPDPQTSGAPATPVLRLAASAGGASVSDAEIAPSFEMDPATGQHWSPFTSGDGRTLTVLARLEPVYELKRMSRIGLRLVREVIDLRRDEELSRAQVKALTSADILQADLAGLGRGLERLRMLADGEPLSLIAPMSYASLVTLRGRTELTRLLKAAAALLRVGVIGEIGDIEGLPDGFLMSAVSLIKPHTLLVAGRLERPASHQSHALRNEGLNAVCLECPRDLTDPQFRVWAQQAITPARHVARSVIVYGVETRERAAELGALGATHAGVLPSED